MPKARKCSSKILKRSKRSLSCRKIWKKRKDDLQRTVHVAVPVDLSSTSDTIVEEQMSDDVNSIMEGSWKDDLDLSDCNKKVKSHREEIIVEAGPSKIQKESIFETQKDITDMYDSDDSSSFEIFPLDPVMAMSQEEYNSIMDEDISVEKENIFSEVLPGHRIVDFGFVLKWAIGLQYRHSKICSGILYPSKEESKGLGLVKYIHFKCTFCDGEEIHATEDPNKPVSLINVGAVWGTLATGHSYGHLQEQLACMDIPPMSKRKFNEIENSLGDDETAVTYGYKYKVVQKHRNLLFSFFMMISCHIVTAKSINLLNEIIRFDTLKDMELAHEEEKRVAVEKNNIDPDGIPYITVILDGGWSKRSYGHNYNAISGVGVIIGLESGKILFVGVRNKYCVICSRAHNKKIQPKDHKCFRNWTDSSPAMESDIIVEGFCLAEQMYGVRYKYFIADGDSSVHSKIIERVPYGREVRKSECMNHALKNYGKVLYGIKNDTKIKLPTRKSLTKEKIKELQKVAQLSIYNCDSAKDLREDLRNGPLHVFGHHVSCKNYYCNNIGDTQDSTLDEIKRSGCYNYIYGALDSLLGKADKLISNMTSNKAEVFMNIVARFNDGKRLNLVSRGSFQRRCILSQLRYNKSANWHTDPWKSATMSEPGKYFGDYIKKFMKEREKKAQRPKYKKKSIDKENVPNRDYGPKAEQPEPTDDIIEKKCQDILKNLQVTQEQRDFIEQNTKKQFDSDLYITERSNRLTASNFGNVVKRKPNTPCHNLVKQILYPKEIYTESINYGKVMESLARKKFEELMNVKVEDAGLFIDLENGYLGATPDGLLGDDTILEIKCLHKVAKLGISLEDATKKNICLEVFEDQLRLKRNHSYYYQIQGQLNICRRNKCYFVVFVNSDRELFVETIVRDEKLWNETMLPKLSKFYKERILQELVRRRITRGLRCYDPDPP